MKKLLLLMLCMIFLIGNVSSANFDDFKYHDKETTTYTLKNFFGLGKHIADLELKTPQMFEVPRGYQKVAEIEIRNGEFDYDEIINGIELYDIKDNMKEFVRDVDYKYKTHKDVEVNDYKSVCDELTNGTKTNCRKEKIGNHIEQREVWEDFTENSLLKGEVITLGIFTNVQKGDHVEWIINVYGNERLTKWAGFSESLKADLKVYWQLNESSGDLIDEIGNINLTLQRGSPTYEQQGIIDYAIKFDSQYEGFTATSGSDQSVVDFGETDDFSVNFWINFTDLSLIAPLMFSSNIEDSPLFGFLSTAGTISVNFRVADTGLGVVTTTGNMTLYEWNMITAIRNNSGQDYWLFKNNVLVDNTIGGGLEDAGGGNLSLGDIYRINNYFYATIDEIGIWARELNVTEMTDLYNSGAGLRYEVASGDASPIITLNSPTNHTNSTTNSITFNCTGSDDLNFINMSLILDDAINETNSSGINNTFYYFTKNLAEGNTYWSCRGADNASQFTTAGANLLNINTAPVITVLSPTNTSYTISTIFFNATSSLSVDKWIVNYNGTNTTLTDINTSLTVEDGNHHLLLYANDSTTGVFGLNDTIYFSVDTVAPVINITDPVNGSTNLTDYITVDNATIDLKWTTTDANIDKCWYWNSTANVTITCDDNATIYLPYNQYTFYFYANDTFGNEVTESITATWNYSVLENSLTYNNYNYETANETLEINISYYNEDWEAIAVNLVYNGTSNTATKYELNDFIIFNITIDIPELTGTSAENKSFYWNTQLTNNTGTFQHNSTEYNQTVNPLPFQICAGNTNVTLLNFTAWHEENITRIMPFDFYGTFRFWIGDGTISKNISISNASVDHVDLCTDNSSLTYYADAHIQYEETLFIKRTYYLINDTLTASMDNISLILLPDSASTSFILEILDEVQLPIDNAYIYIQRYYPGDDTFRTVEMGRTDITGSTVGHFEAETENYRVIVEKDGEIIYQSGSQKIFCEETPCKLTFQTEAGAGISWTEIGIIDLFDWDMIYDESGTTWTFNYTDTSEEIGYGRLYVYYDDPEEGEVEICNESSSSLAATLTCNVSGYNGTIYASAYLSRSPEILITLQSIVISALKAIFGLEGLFLSFFVLMVLAFAGLWNPTVGIILVVVGMIVLNITGLAVFGATAIWSIIFIALLILWNLKT